MLPYSEMVHGIKNNTLDDLVKLLAHACICKIEGSTRDTYMFDMHVVKVNNYHRMDTNAREYNAYCKYHTGKSNIPVVFTRKYRTKDGYTVLIQERMFRVIQLVGYSEKQAHMYDSVANDGKYETLLNLRKDLQSAGIPTEAFYDGMQCGYNRHGSICFYDYQE